jgi:DNA-binding PucR family transcriptional regulator
VTSLLRGDSDTFAAARSKLLPPNVAMQWPVRVLLVEHGTESPSSTAAAIRSLVTRRDTVYAEINGDIVVVTALANCEEFAQQISDKLEQVFGRKSSVVVSDEIADFASVPRHYQALRHCLKLLRHLGQPGRVAMECSLRPYAVLFKEQDEDSLRRFVVQEVGALLDYDSKRKTQLTKTLLAFLDHGRSLQKTADFLDAHVNTIRQRLDTISQLKEGWADPSRCLDVHIALRLHSLSGAALC